MSYSTPAAVRLAITQTTDGQQPVGATSGTAADLSDTQLQDAIGEADSMIDVYLGSVYTTPVALVGGVVPHPLDYWSRNIAAYNATLAFRQSLDFTDNDPIARRYLATMDALKQVAAGSILLPFPVDTSGSQREMVGAPVNPYTGQLWTADSWNLVYGDRLLPGNYRPFYPGP